MLSSGVLSMEEVNQLQEPMATPSGMSQVLRSFEKSFDFEGKNMSCFQNGEEQEPLTDNCSNAKAFPEFNEVMARSTMVKEQTNEAVEGLQRTLSGTGDLKTKLRALPVAGVLKEVKQEQKKSGRKRRANSKKSATKRRKKSPSFTEGGRWTKEEDEQLRKAVDCVGAKNWKLISRKYLNGSRSDVQCLHRWQKVLKPGLVKGPWTKIEDETILRAIKSGMTKWSEIANQIPGRIGKQCRERWFNHLDPSIKKSGWTSEEDKILLEYQSRLGNRWCEIAKSLPGRSENSVKNRWNSAMRKRKSRKLSASNKPGQATSKKKRTRGKAARGSSGKVVRKNSVIEAREKMETYDVKVPGAEKTEADEYTKLLQYKAFKSRLEARAAFAHVSFSGADRRRAHNLAVELLSKMKAESKPDSALDIELFWKRFTKIFKPTTSAKKAVKSGKENSKSGKRKNAGSAQAKRKKKPEVKDAVKKRAYKRKAPKSQLLKKQAEPEPQTKMQLTGGQAEQQQGSELGCVRAEDLSQPAKVQSPDGAHSLKSREALKIEVTSPLLPLWNMNISVSPPAHDTVMNRIFGDASTHSPLHGLVEVKEHSPEVDENALLTAELLEADNPISFQLL